MFLQVLLKLFDSLLSQSTLKIELIMDVTHKELCWIHDLLNTKLEHYLSPRSSWRSRLIKNSLKLLNIVQVVNKTWVMLVLKSSFNISVWLSQKLEAFLFAIVVIVLLDLRILILHFISQHVHELFFDLTDGNFGEVLDGLLLWGAINVLKLIVIEWTTSLKFNFDCLHKDFIWVINSFVTLVSADISPRRLDWWDRSFVDSLHIGSHQVP